MVTVSIGLLVSACVNRAPEGLFGAAVAEVGVHDLLKVRSHTTRFYTHYYCVSLFQVRGLYHWTCLDFRLWQPS